MKLRVNDKKCPQDHVCPAMRVCPQGAITQKDKYTLPEIDEALCILCGKCIKFCPKGAFEMDE